MSIGLKRGTVTVEPYNPAWALEFENEKKQLLQTFGDRIIGVEHIGSTAVPQLAAKPIIDMLAAVKSFDDIHVFIEGLQQLGYEYMLERMTPTRKFFPKGPQNKRTHHLNIVLINDHDQWTKPLAFRDYLRNHKTERQEYAKLKINLAKQYANDRALYTKSKDKFIVRIFDKSLL